MSVRSGSIMISASLGFVVYKAGFGSWSSEGWVISAFCGLMILIGALSSVIQLRFGR